MKSKWKPKDSLSSLQGFHVDTLTMDRVSPLHEACLGGHYACAKFLLDSGANVRTLAVFSLEICSFLGGLWSKCGGICEHILNKEPLLFSYIRSAGLLASFCSLSHSSTGGGSINRWRHTSLQLLQQREFCLCQTDLAAQCLRPHHIPAGITHPWGCEERFVCANMYRYRDVVCHSTESDAVLFLHQITEIVWSCCSPMELILTWSCRLWERRCILPAWPKLQPA